MTHPVLQKMSLIGCQDRKAILLAFQTYMELCEVEVLWNVDYHFNEELGLIYLQAANKPGGEGNLYVPISFSRIITPEWILKIQKQMEDKHKNSTFTFVIRAEDSTSVHYKVSPGLAAPLSPEAAKQKKLTDEKRLQFGHEINKRKSELIAAANKALEDCESTRDKTSENHCDDDDDDDDECEEVPITVTIDDDDDENDGDSNQSRQVEIIEL